MVTMKKGNAKIFKTTHWKGRVNELKAWMEKGQALTYMIKYMVLLFGLASQDVKNTLIFGLIYVFVSFIIGFMWYRYGFQRWEIEVQNIYNLFVEEMREKIGKSL